MNDPQAEQMGSLEEATKNAAQLLDLNPGLAAEQAEAILEAIPNHPPAMFLLASALRRQGKPQAALEIVEPLLDAQHKWAAAWFEYGVALGMLKRGDDAIAALLRAVKYQPEHPEAWRFLADHLMATGDNEAADSAYARHVSCSTHDPQLQEAAAAMVKKEIGIAERWLKRYLSRYPTDVAAIRMLAEVAIRCERNAEAKRLLQRCLELSPSFLAARANLALLLHRCNDAPAALIEIEKCLEADPERANFRNLCAVILSRVGEYARSSDMYSSLLSEYPRNPKVWLSYGHVLKTEGRLEKCVETYREAIRRDPAFGEAYWSLANLKTFRFSDAELLTIQEKLSDPDLPKEARWHFQFALGKAYEDAENYEKSFEYYEAGNSLYRKTYGYTADRNTIRAQRLKDKFSSKFFAQRQGYGCTATDPIFIVGMPRSGSTLLEQILSCHSAIEGTMELPDIITLAQELRGQAEESHSAAYVDVLESLSPDEVRSLGESYIERTRIHRKTDRPFFIDKMPNNFLHVGMIRLLLPNAKVIDARRHPMGCCFSNFKQFYAHGQNFSYGLTDMGRFYYDYVDLMAHYDRVLPGYVHRTLYEDTVTDTERVIREVLGFCGLEYESACLHFYASKRPVRTASSEQVRQPIYQAGVEQWKRYEQWLDPLKEALGDVLTSYPEVPEL